MLKNHIVDIDNRIGGSDWIFQQNNAPHPHLHSYVTWFKSQKINVLSWLSLSSDLNSIKNLWGILSRKIHGKGKQFRTKGQLKTAIVKSLEKIGLDQLRNLVNSMPERIFEVIKLNGAKTKY